MNEVFIWLSGLRFIDQFLLLMARNFFKIFTENKPVRGLRTKYNIPDVNWLTGLTNLTLTYWLPRVTPPGGWWGRVFNKNPLVPHPLPLRILPPICIVHSPVHDKDWGIWPCAVGWAPWSETACARSSGAAQTHWLYCQGQNHTCNIIRWHEDGVIQARCKGFLHPPPPQYLSTYCAEYLVTTNPKVDLLAFANWIERTGQWGYVTRWRALFSQCTKLAFQ